MDAAGTGGTALQADGGAPRPLPLIAAGAAATGGAESADGDRAVAVADGLLESPASRLSQPWANCPPTLAFCRRRLGPFKVIGPSHPTWHWEEDSRVHTINFAADNSTIALTSRSGGLRRDKSDNRFCRRAARRARFHLGGASSASGRRGPGEISSRAEMLQGDYFLGKLSGPSFRGPLPPRVAPLENPPSSLVQCAKRPLCLACGCATEQNRTNKTTGL